MSNLMKTLIPVAAVALLVFCSQSAMASPRHGGHHSPGHHSGYHHGGGYYGPGAGWNYHAPRHRAYYPPVYRHRRYYPPVRPGCGYGPYRPVPYSYGHSYGSYYGTSIGVYGPRFGFGVSF